MPVSRSFDQGLRNLIREVRAQEKRRQQQGVGNAMGKKETKVRSQREAKLILKIRRIAKKPFRAEPNEYKERFEAIEELLKELEAGSK